MSATITFTTDSNQGVVGVMVGVNRDRAERIIPITSASSPSDLLIISPFGSGVREKEAVEPLPYLLHSSSPLFELGRVVE